MPEEMIEHLINIVDMYINEEERHYAECYNNEEAANNHIFHDLLAVSHWLKERHTMIDEDVSAEIQMLKEKSNE